MINGATSEHDKSFVTRTEFAPYAQKTDTNTVSIAVLSSEFKTMGADIAHIKLLITNLDSKVTPLQNNEALRTWIIKGLFKVGSAIAFLLTANFMGIMKVVHKIVDLF
jgi:hypothetical protein